MITLFLLLTLGFSLAIGAFSVFLALTWYLLLAFGRWRMFEKMGIEGWKGFIPFYADYILYGRCWQTMFFWIALAASILYGILGGGQENPGFLASLVGAVGSVVEAVLCWKESRAFGHNWGVALGLMLLEPIFTLYLGIGPDYYMGPQ